MPAEKTASQTPTFFESIALPLTERGWKVVPCLAKDKTVDGVLVPRPLEQMSADPEQIRAWGKRSPRANVAVYAQQIEGGLCFLDKDGARNIREAYEAETGKKFPRTMFVRSSIQNGIEKGHWYFGQTARTRSLTKNIAEDATNGWFSFRVKNEYVCTIGSIHPKTGKPYEVADDCPIVPMPDDLLVWLQAQVSRKSTTPQTGANEGRAKIPKGQRYTALISEIGRLWQRGTYSRELTITMGVEWARENYEIEAGDVFDPARVRKRIEHLIDSYPPGPGVKPAATVESHLVIRSMDDVQELPVEWLWPNKIPMSALTAFTGNPDCGKTMAYCDLIARVTTERDFPDAKFPDGVGGEVIMLCSEDDYARVIKPRLLVAGADTASVFFVEKVEIRQGAKRDERMFALDTDLSKLEQELGSGLPYSLIIIDPISAYFGRGNMNNKQDVRTVFNRLTALCEKYRVAVVVVEHFSKRVDVAAIHRLGGSVALTAATRAAFMFAKVPDAEGEYVMHFIKGNFAKRKSGLRFTIGDKELPSLGTDPETDKPRRAPYVVWGAEDASTADDLLRAEKGASDDNRAARAERFLREYLTEEKLSDEVMADAQKKNISRKALYDVKKNLGIRAVKRGTQWFWSPAVKEPQQITNPGLRVVPGPAPGASRPVEETPF